MKFSNRVLPLFFLLLPLLSFAVCVESICFAQYETNRNETGIEEFQQENEGNNAETSDAESNDFDGGFAFFVARFVFWGIIIALLLFFERRNEQSFAPVSESFMLAERAKNENAFNQNMSEEERNQRAEELGKAVFDSWKDAPNSPGYKTIANRKQAKKTRAGIKDIIALSPTDPEIIDNLNELIRVYNVQTRRYSVASAGVLTGVAAVILLIGGGAYVFSEGRLILYMVFAFCADIIAYLVAARAPLYLIQNGFWIASSGMTNALTSTSLAGMSNYTVTSYIDRSTGSVVRTEYDFSSGYANMLVFALISAVLFAFFPLLVLVNIARNHVLYK